MKISKIQHKNGYKRFHDLTIDLGKDPKRIIALVGPNGCGKSSVFDGMLYVNNNHYLIGNKDRKNHEYHSMNKVHNFNHENVIITFVNKSFSEVWQQKQLNNSQNTIFSFRSPYRYNSNLKVTESRATSPINMNNYGASTASDLDDKMEESYRRLNIKYTLYLNAQDCTPSQAKIKIIGDLNSSLNNCLDLQITSIGNIEANQGTLFFKKSDQDTDFEFNVLSSGEKEVVDILLDLYLRQDEFNETIFLFDEPELHINTSIQKKLLIEINKLIGENCQIWISTHSIGFLRALQDELKDQCQIIKFEQNANLASTPCVLKPMQKSISNWKDIFETALDDLTGLVSPKRIIYCEGKDTPGAGGKEKGLDANVFNNIFSEKYHDTLFVSSGGNTELDKRSDIAIALLSKVLSDLEIWVLKDRDMASGKPVDESQRQLYLNNNPKSHRVLKRWEIENYLFDKEVLMEYCKQNTLEFNEIDYDSFVSDIENQNLKDETTRIKKICNIPFSINPETFKLNLSKCIHSDMKIFTQLEQSIFNRF